MKKSKKQKLEAAGWRVGSAAEFLGLSPEEEAIVDMKVALAAGVKNRRIASGLTQSDLASKLGSSQSRIAKLESSDPSVSIDLLMRALLALGTSRAELAKLIGKKSSRAA